MKEQAEPSAQSDYCALQARVAAIIERHKSESRINPAWIATEAINEIDPRRFNIKSIPHFYRAAHVALTQIARGLLGMPDDEGYDRRTPDEILAEGEAQRDHNEAASGPPGGQTGDNVILLDLNRNRPFPDEGQAANGLAAAVTGPRGAASNAADIIVGFD